jgi:hypothetical protein
MRYERDWGSQQLIATISLEAKDASIYSAICCTRGQVQEPGAASWIDPILQGAWIPSERDWLEQGKKKIVP